MTRGGGGKRLVTGLFLSAKSLMAARCVGGGRRNFFSLPGTVLQGGNSGQRLLQHWGTLALKWGGGGAALVIVLLVVVFYPLAASLECVALVVMKFPS